MSYPNRIETVNFFRSALSWKEAITPKILKRVFISAAYAVSIMLVFRDQPISPFDLGPLEISGGVLAVLVVLRTNAGHDRWWEARRLWGGIVNQCRNLVIGALQYGPSDIEWRKQITYWTIAFAHTCRRSLRNERHLPELEPFFSLAEIEKIKKATHMPSYASKRISLLLQQAKNNTSLDGFSFLQIDREKALLIDHIGGCERILNTPIPLVLAVMVRRFILVFLIFLPFVLIPKAGSFTPLIMIVISYPLFALDQIAVELQNPFDSENRSHLPLENVTTLIEGNLLSLLEYQE
jgi:ion channel-forming bestrophin family protein